MLIGHLIKSSSCSKQCCYHSDPFQYRTGWNLDIWLQHWPQIKIFSGGSCWLQARKTLRQDFSLRYKMWPDAELTGGCWNKERRRNPVQVKRYGVKCCLLIRYNTNAKSLEGTLDVPEVRFLLCGNFSSPGDWNMMRSAKTLKSPLPL